MSTRIFLFEADHLALDFLNAELEAAPEALVDWLLQAGLAQEADARRLAASPPLARILAVEAQGLRDALASLVEGFARGDTLRDSGLFALNRALDGRRLALRLEPRGGGVALVEAAEGRFPEGLLAPVAAAAAELLAAGDRTRVRRCAAEGCGRWFHDVSKNGRRRWCSMARCGNRAKVAAHYRRRRAAPGGPATAATGGRAAAGP